MLQDKELFEESLRELTNKIKEYNAAQQNDEQKITRVKLVFKVCFGDAYIQTESFTQIAAQLCAIGVDVSTSAADPTQESSAVFFNGKNDLSASDIENTTIVERLFSATKLPEEKWKSAKYLDCSAEKRGEMFCYKGKKLYKTPEAFFSDKYEKPSPITAPSASYQAISTSKTLDR